ncbi:MAG: hypothetical protein D6722_14195 [Bacteroidetes bacterium]|nr:MAG: hypothetical protein D6722_14195 [Bacteroidota bacterium]
MTGTIVGLDEANHDTIGVAFGAYWMGSPAIGCGPANSLATFQWALDPDGDPTTTGDMPDGINNSWGFTTGNTASFCNGAWVSALNAAEAVGIAVVFSAGNEGAQGPSSITAPKVINTDLVNSFCVGNVNGNVPSFPLAGSSSQGPTTCGGTGSWLIKPEVSAPGTGVRSAVPGNGYASFTGTSMAAPHVSAFRATRFFRHRFPLRMRACWPRPGFGTLATVPPPPRKTRYMSMPTPACMRLAYALRAHRAVRTLSSKRSP